MNRRDFIATAAAAAAATALPVATSGQEQQTYHGFPPSVLVPDSYVEIDADRGISSSFSRRL